MAQRGIPTDQDIPDQERVRRIAQSAFIPTSDPRGIQAWLLGSAGRFRGVDKGLNAGLQPEGPIGEGAPKTSAEQETDDLRRISFAARITAANDEKSRWSLSSVLAAAQDLIDFVRDFWTGVPPQHRKTSFASEVDTPENRIAHRDGVGLLRDNFSNGGKAANEGTSGSASGAQPVVTAPNVRPLLVANGAPVYLAPTYDL